MDVPLPARDAYPAEQQQLEATVCSVRPDKGFVLVELDGYPDLPRPALLHIREMTDAFRERFDGGQVSLGDRLQVQVLTVTPDIRRSGQMKIDVRDLASVTSGEPEKDPVS